LPSLACHFSETTPIMGNTHLQDHYDQQAPAEKARTEMTDKALTIPLCRIEFHVTALQGQSTKAAF